MAQFSTEYRDSDGELIACRHNSADAVFLHLKAAGSLHASEFAIFADGLQLKAVEFFSRFPLTFGLQNRARNETKGGGKTAQI